MTAARENPVLRRVVPAAAQDDVATLALALLTVVTALGMGRLFSNSSFVVPVLAAAVAVHGSAWACRRLGIGGILTLPISFGALLLVAAWTVLPESTAAGIPWKGTLDAAIGALTDANQKFGQVVAPVEPAGGFVLGAVLGVGLVALMADWAAFRVRSTWESVVPAFGLFVFTSLLGSDRWQWWVIGAQVVAILGVVCTHWARVRVSSTPWLGSRASTAGGTQGAPAAMSVAPLLSGAAMLTALAVGAALFVGPRLPGANDPPLIGVRDESDTGPGKRTTISPLVDIRGRLTERSDREAFTVKTNNQKAYWRLTALDTFDGQIWSSNDSYRKSGRELERVGPRARAAQDIVQEYSIKELASIWLPAAYQPLEIEGVEGVSYNAESGSAISKFPTSDGLNYTVRSARPSFTRAELSIGEALAPASLRSHLELPDGIPAEVQQLARDIVAAADAQSPFTRALALQDYLRDNYQYDINIDQGHGRQALSNFLFSTKRGYCEQFAGSYAVLARLVGLPSRVAVGFTPGDFDQAAGVYRVKGIHAHAWPEVFIQGAGWVLFEPTPGRGAPGAESYTGVAEAQETSGGQGQIPATTQVPSETAGTQPPAAESTTTTEVPNEEPGAGAGLARSLSRILLVLLGAAAIMGLWLVAVPLLRRARRRRRRSAARTAADRVLVAWTEADESLRVARARRRPSETLVEHAARAGGSVPPDARQALQRLASDATSASYSEVVPTGAVPSAVDAAEIVERSVWNQATRGAKLKRALDPRP
ncbi:MAG TPA: DUF3488 and transglutaminase-like domain-containing protein [Acidimicrobiales bacterium]|nr:DUF3488 and transglutaminase-like domain-containing protein [Acidimicrobiales bacterium]